MTTIYFDMDGTIADLYGVDGWLPMLRSRNPKPYKDARPLVNMRVFARLLNILHNEGYRIGVISWLAKDSTPQYDEEVEYAKRLWLTIHLKSVKFDEVHIVKYGTPKSTIARKGSILFDDEYNNRREFVEADENNIAYDVGAIIRTIKDIIAQTNN
jgi:hypothetical protein